MISRRRFLALTSSAIVAAPLDGKAQQTTVYRIAYLTDAIFGLPDGRDAFRQGLRELGYVEGQNIIVDYRHASKPEDRQVIATELLRQKPQVVVIGSGVMEFRKLLEPLPLVFVAFSDPVGAGLAASLARPGGNITGFSYLGLELNTKRLEMLKEAVPSAIRIGALAAIGHPTLDRQRREIEAGARHLGIQLHIHEVDQSSPAALDVAFETMARENMQAVIALQGPGFFRERTRVVELALRYRLPAIFEIPPFAEAGGLMSYGPKLADLFRRAAGLVDKILKGAKPGDLPIEQPTKFAFVINMRTAKALGLTIPPSLLLRADHVIE